MAYYALHKLRILPGQLMALSEEERAFIYAAIDLRGEAERRAEAEARAK